MQTERLVEMFYWIGVAVVAAIALDFCIVAWRNLAALRLAAGAAVPSQAAGFLPVVGFGAMGVALELAKVFLGVGRTVAADAGGIVAALIGIIPGVLESLKNPLIAALVFGLVGLAAGGRMADVRHADKIASAIRGANTRADVAIKAAVERANARADEAIAKIRADAARKPTKTSKR
jgi:hypothetical protein